MKLGLPICLILVWAFVHEANTGKIDGINLSQLEPEEYGLMEVPPMDREPEEYGLMEVSDRELVQSEDRVFGSAAYFLGKAGYVIWKCRKSAKNAAGALAKLRSETLKKIKAQIPNIKSGKKSEVVKALKDILSPTGAVFKAIDKAAGCLASHYGFKAVSLSATVEGAAGASKSVEIGIGKSFGKSDTMVFVGYCSGIKTDISLGGALNVAFWKDIGSIPGTSYAAEAGIGSGILTGAVDIGGSVGAVFSKGWKKLLWGIKIPTVSQIGTTFSVGLGAGIAPADVSVAKCYAKKI